jgi:predicted membrane channel-forming protein YqfA (hemolysin III family)
MGIFRAFGFGIFLLILASLMPLVFQQLSSTAIAFLESSQEAFAAAGTLASYSSNIPFANLPSTTTLSSAPSFIPPSH